MMTMMVMMMMMMMMVVMMMKNKNKNSLLSGHWHNVFDSEKLSQICIVLLTGFEPRGLWISSPTLRSTRVEFLYNVI